MNEPVHSKDVLYKTIYDANSQKKHYEKQITEAFPRPPVGLLHGGELDVPVQQQSVKQVGGAALGLTDDVEIRQAAQPVHLAVSVVQVSLEVSPQAVADCSEALGA